MDRNQFQNPNINPKIQPPPSMNSPLRQGSGGQAGQSPFQEPQGKKTFTPKFLAVIAVLLIVGGGAFWYSNRLAWQNYEKVAEEAMKAQEDTPAARSTGSGQFDVPSNWQTYRNEEYGFEFRYPKIFEEKENRYENKNSIRILRDNRDFDEYSGNIEISILNSNIDPNYIFPIFVLGDEELKKDFKERDIIYHSVSSKSIANAEWRIIDTGEGPGDCFGVYYQTDHNNIIVEIYFKSCEYYPKSFLNRSTGLQHQILSTFRFIDKIDTSKWKTFRQEVGLYEMNIPNNWDVFSGSGDSCGGDHFGLPNQARSVSPGISVSYYTDSCAREEPQQILSREDFVLDGELGTKEEIIDANGNKKIRILIDKGITFEITIEDLTYLDEFNHAISTFRFLE